MADVPLASLSLTHVHYNPEDPISYLCAWLALVPQGLCVIYVTLIWATRETEVILMFAGQMACEVLNFSLKRLIKEERPKQMYGKGYGMPSSHAQFMAFFSVSLTLFLLCRHRPPPNTASWPSIPILSRLPYPSLGLQCFLISTAALLLAAAVAVSRTYLNYHTQYQVLIGCLAGVCSAILWFGIVSLARYQGYLDMLLDMEISRWLRLRDLLVEEDIVESGWKEWERRRVARRLPKQRKNA